MSRRFPLASSLDEDGTIHLIYTHEEFIAANLDPKRGTWKRIGMDEVSDFFVSTVFLGIGIPFNDNGFFETMVYYRGEPDYARTRFSTLEEAKEGHLSYVLWVLAHSFKLAREEKARKEEEKVRKETQKVLDNRSFEGRKLRLRRPE